jgi:hypothetical protein
LIAEAVLLFSWKRVYIFKAFLGALCVAIFVGCVDGKFVLSSCIHEVIGLVDVLEFLHEINDSITQAIFAFVTANIRNLSRGLLTIALNWVFSFLSTEISCFTPYPLIAFRLSLICFPFPHFIKGGKRFSTIWGLQQSVMKCTLALAISLIVLSSVTTEPGLFPIWNFN